MILTILSPQHILICEGDGTIGHRFFGIIARLFSKVLEICAFRPKTLNRADGKNTLQAKHILGPADGPADGNPNLARYGLTCVEDVRKGSVISQEDLGEWELATNQRDVHNWSDPNRIRAFRRAVDKRRSAIYQDFFDRLGFKEWLEK